ncbi:MAG: DoxX family protein [Roseivirga sp.]|nr:DoxX family protein [Roseivirga sp.]
MLKRLLNTGNHSSNIDLSLLIFRAGVGIMMLTHGYPKFLRLIAGEFRFGDPLGLGVEASLILAVLAEFVCSILLVLGLTTRYALVPLIIMMAVAGFVVHGNDPFGTQEKSVLYLLTFVVLMITGPGRYSLDKRLFG